MTTEQTRLQFRVLYREFLFRMVDLELLSSQGDITKLLGQFAGLLLFASFWLALGGMLFGGGHMTPAQYQTALWAMEHFFISTTMLAMGLFSVLSWDSTFPNRRDVLVLGPLPVRVQTLFLAKLAALGGALGLTVGALHGFCGWIWPLHFIPAHSNLLLGYFRSLLSHWTTMFLAGAFTFAIVLGVQGLAAQLPRGRFLRLSSYLQMGFFSLFVCGYFLQPRYLTPAALSAPEHQHLLAWLPPYWFLALFHQLNGSLDPAMAPLVSRAWIGLAIASAGAGSAFLLSYFRTMRKIMEEPDILPGSHGFHWMPRFGNLMQTAIVAFSIRGLLRSRQHRMILAFYLGLGFAIMIFFTGAIIEEEHRMHLATGTLGRQVNPALLAASIVMMIAWIVGTRMVFAMPLELRANWVFRVTALPGPQQCLTASRRALLLLSVAPMWLASAILFLTLWPWRPALGHVVALGLFGIALAEFSLRGFHKIPFTCSYLPGKSSIHMLLIPAMGVFLAVVKAVEFEYRALGNGVLYAEMVAALAPLAVVARFVTVWQSRTSEAEVRFEENPEAVVQVLGLARHGAIKV